MNFYKDQNGKPYSSYSDKEYFSCTEFVGSSELKKIANGKSTDYLNVKVEDNVNFRIGTAFHLAVQDQAKGGTSFNENYFVTKNTRPLKIFEILDELEIAEEKYKRNKEIVKELKENNGKFPITEEEAKKINLMLRNFENLEFRGLKIMDCITEGEVEMPFFWEFQGLKKKCKPDFFFRIEEEIFLFDIKTYGKEIEFFKYDFKNMAHWVQSCHYREGLQNFYPEYKINPMSFVVSSKKEPHLCGVFSIDNSKNVVEAMERDYREVCDKYKGWLKNNKESIGTIEEQTLFYN